MAMRILELLLAWAVSSQGMKKKVAAPPGQQEKRKGDYITPVEKPRLLSGEVGKDTSE